MEDWSELYLSKLKYDMKAYNNFFAILNKAEHDGYIKSYLNFLDGVFRKELQYAINELNKLK